MNYSSYVSTLPTGLLQCHINWKGQCTDAVAHPMSQAGCRDGIRDAYSTQPPWTTRSAASNFQDCRPSVHMYPLSCSIISAGALNAVEGFPGHVQ